MTKKVGSVSAEIKIDTKQAEEAIDKLLKDTQKTKNVIGASIEETNSVIDNLVGLTDKLQEQQRGVSAQTSRTADELAKEVDKLKQLAPELDNTAKSTNDAVKANKELVKSNKEVEKSFESTAKYAGKTAKEIRKTFSETLYGLLVPIDSGGAVDFVVDDIVKKMKKKFKGLSDEEFTKAFNQALKDTNTTLTQTLYGLEGAEIHIKNLHRPMIDMASDTEKVADNTKKVTESLKEAEAQSTKTFNTLQKDFIKWFHLSVERAKPIGQDHIYDVPLKPVYDDLKQHFKNYISDRKEFEELLGTALTVTGTSLKPTRDPADGIGFGKRDKKGRYSKHYAFIGNIDDMKSIDEVLEIIGEEAPVLDKVTESTEKATKAIEQETVAQKNLNKAIDETLAKKAMIEETYSYLGGLKKGRKGKTWTPRKIVGKDSIYSGKTDELGELKEFDLSKYISHMEGVFKDLIPQKLYNQIIAEIMKRYKIGATRSNVEGVGGLPVDKFDDLRIASDVYSGSLKELRENVDETIVATKELEKGLIDLSGNTKYPFEELYKNIDKLPEKVRTAVEGVFRALYKRHDGFYPVDGKSRKNFLEDVNAWKGYLPMMDWDKFMKDSSTYKNRKNTFLDIILGSGYHGGSHTEPAPQLYDNPVLKGQIGGLAFHPKEMKEVYENALEMLKYAEPVLIKSANDVETVTEEVEKLKESEEKASSTTEKLTKDTKALGEASKYTATQIKILKDIHGKASVHAGMKEAVTGTPSTKAPFSNLYAHLENEYLEELTGMNPKNVINPSKLKKRFQYMIKDLFDDLGIQLLSEVPPTFEGMGRTIKYTAKNFAGQRVGMYDAGNLISEEELSVLIGETKQLEKEEEKLADSTKKATNEIKEEQAWVMTLANVLKTQLHSPMNTFTQDSNKIIDDLTRMARANELFSGSAQKTANALKQINKMKESGYAFGFKGDDLFDARYIRNTGRAMKEARILPRNKENRKYSGWDKRFLMKFFESLYQTPLGTADRIFPSALKIPSEKNLNTRLGNTFAYQEQYLRDYDDNYKQFVKDIQTHIIGLLKEFNIELSTELAGAGKKIRVWIEELGKYKNIGSLDISNMIRFDDIDELERFLDRATKGNKELESQLEKTTVAIKNFKKSFAETAGMLIRKEFQENPLIGTKQGGGQKGKKYFYIDGMNIIKQLKEIYGLAGMADAEIADLIYDSQILMGLTGKLRFSDVVKGLDSKNPKLIESTISALDTSLVNEELVKTTDNLEYLSEAEAKTTVETEKLSSAMLDLSGKTKYSLSFLMDNLHRIPEEYAKITKWINDRNSEFAMGDFAYIRQILFALRDLQKGKLSYRAGLRDYVINDEEIIQDTTDFYKIFDFKSIISDSEKLAKSTDKLTESIRRFAEQLLVGELSINGYVKAIMELQGIPYENNYISLLSGNWEGLHGSDVRKYFTRQEKGEKYVDIPYKTWEEIQQLPVTIKNWIGYGKMTGGQFGIDSNQTTLDLEKEMYTFKELMEQFWGLPVHYQEILLDIQRQIKELYGGKLPKDLSKSKLRQLNMGLSNKETFEFVKWYDQQYPDRNRPSFHPLRAIKDIPIDYYGTTVSPEEIQQFYEEWDKWQAESKDVKSATEEVVIEVKKLGEAEETTAKSTDKLALALKKMRESPEWKGERFGVLDDVQMINSLINEVTPMVHDAIQNKILKSGERKGHIKLNPIIDQLKQMFDLTSLTNDEIGRLIYSLSQFMGLTRTSFGAKGNGKEWVDFYLGSSDKRGFIDKETMKPFLEVVEAEKEMVAETEKVKDKVTELKQGVEENIPCLDDFTGGVEKATKAEKDLEVQTGRIVPALRNVKKIQEEISNYTPRTNFISNMYGGTRNNAIESIIEDVDKRYDDISKLTSKILSDGSKVTGEIKQIGETATASAKKIGQLVTAVGRVGKPHNLSNLLSFPETLKFPDYTPVESAKGKIEDLSETMHRSVEGGKKFVKIIYEVKGALGNIGSTSYEPLENLPMVLDKATNSERRFERQTRQTGNTLRKTAHEYNNIFKQLNNLKFGTEEGGFFTPIDSRNLKTWNVWGDGFARSGETVANTTKSLKTFDNTVLSTANDIKTKLIGAMRAFYEYANQNEFKIPDEAINSWKQALADIEGFEARYRVLMQRMYNLSRGLGKWINEGKESTGYGKLLEDMKRNPIYEWVKVEGEWKRQFKGYQKTVEEVREGSLGRLNVVGYSDYVARISEIKQALESTTVSTNQYKESLSLLAEAIKLNANELTGFVGKAEGAVIALTQMAEANERFARTGTLGEKVTALDTMIYGDKGLKGLGANSGLVSTLEHFSGLSDKHFEKLNQFKEQAIAIRNSFEVLNQSFAEGTISTETYEREITKLTEKMKVLEELSRKGIREVNLVEPKKMNEVNEGLEKGKKSLKEWGTTMKQDEEYANALYRGLQRARGVIVSIKTIGRMMGGMALWNYAFEMMESAKETYKAKNEMESLLAKNEKVSAGGISAYNKELDKTVDRFKKINKYSLGETGASIGLEFNLNGQQMGKSLPIIAMIQSEYVRAGRTVEEASLAVKDILQGEFMRLSRETGVGKDDLMEKYGWNGDNTDVLNLMSALEKAGKERHWDAFAEKATSLNDVLTITQSRFSELGAELATTAEPLIVGAFNTILGAIDGLKQGFEGLGSFGQNMVLILGTPTVLGSIGMAYLSLAKNMGVLDVATIGFNRSLATSILHLNKADVKMHGFWRTLIATTNGVKSAEVAEVNFAKLLAGRILGVDQAILAEKGLGKAMTASVLKTKENIDITKELAHAEEVRKVAIKEGIDVDRMSILTRDKSRIITSSLTNMELTRSQRLAYLTTNLKYSQVAEMGRGEALLRTATSARVLGKALTGLMAINIAMWFASIASWADNVKKNVDGFRNLADNGKEMVKTAQSEYDNIQKSLEQQDERIAKAKEEKKDSAYINKLIREKNALLEDSYTAYKNIGNVQRASEYAERKSRKLERRQSAINAHIDTEKIKALEAVGNTKDDATLMASDEWSKAKAGYYYSLKAQEEAKRERERAIEDAKQHGLILQANGVDQEKINKFMAEYDLKAQEAMEHLKQFNEGDIWAGAYYWLDRLSMEWIKFTNSEYGDKFFKSLQNFYAWIEPSLTDLINKLKDLSKWAIDTFSWLTSTEWGNSVITWTGLSVGIGLVAKKLKDWVFSSKSTVDILKTLKDKLTDVWKGWRKTGKEAEEAGKKMPKGSDQPLDTGGITPEGKLPSEKGLKEGLIEDLKNNVRNYANYATQIAFFMGLVTEAVYLLQAPMWALAEVGKTFKAKEKSIQAGIDGLKLIAPTVIAILVPVMALVKVMDMWGDKLMNIKTIGASVAGIVIGMGLVTEAIILLKAPMWALSQVGHDYIVGKEDMQNGITAIKTLTEALGAMVPIVPIFLAGIALGVAVFTAPEIGLLITGGAFAGILIGIGLVTEAVVALRMPLEGIRELGNSVTDIEGVRKGTEALKLTAEALTYVGSAMTSLALIDVSLLAQTISELVSKWFGVDLGGSLSDLTGEGGVLDQLKTFIDQFATYNITIPDGFEDKITSIKTAGEGVKSIGDAMLIAKQAMDNLPEEFKKGGLTATYDMKTDTTTVKSQDTVSDYFETFKEPIRQLKQFIDEFTTSDEFKIELSEDWETRVGNITKSADMITQINTAVEQVKTAMQNVGSAGHETAFAEGGGLMALGYDIFHMTGEGAINNGSGSGDYKSSLGSSLKAMEDIIVDMFTFQNNISQYAGEGGNGESPDVGGLANMITIVQDGISKLSQTLSDGVPQIKENGKSLGNAIVNGFKDGTSGLNSLGNGIPAKIANGIMNNKDMVYNTSNSLGKTTATKFKEGVDPMSEYMTWELSYVKQAMTDRYDELGQTAYDLGSHIADKFKEGDDINSPGIMARSVQDEVNYIGEFLSVNNLPQMAFDLANALSSNFNIDFNLSNFALPDVSQWSEKLGAVIPIVSGLKMQVSTQFEGMKNNVQNSFNNIVNKTRSSMLSMQSSTLSHIGNIKSSWHGMQDALIASAEHIKSQTSSKIDTLKTHLGEFWNKIKNPDQLIAGGKPSGSIRRRNIPNRKPSLPPFVAGTPMFKPRRSNKDPSNYEREGFLCQLMTGGLCYSGGWDFNWTPDISKKFKEWNTHFNKFNIDSHVKVGSFENSNFPVRGKVDVFRDYINEVIGSTDYDYYYNSRYSPAEALRRGAFNCWDGTQIILALAEAFGITGGGMGSGTWGKDGHVWAIIPGIGVIDPTAIQRGYGFRSPKVQGYGAGSPRRSSPSKAPNSGDVTNNNEVHIHIHGDVYGVDDLNEKIEEGAKKVARQLFRNDYSGV